MRLTIKIGSNVLTRKDGSLDVTRMSALVDQIAWLRNEGHEVILVSSGAVASGRSELKHIQHDLDSVDQRQLFSAVGQAKLINRYFEMFREYGIPVGQVLTTKENFSDTEHRTNQENCMATSTASLQAILLTLPHGSSVRSSQANHSTSTSKIRNRRLDVVACRASRMWRHKRQLRASASSSPTERETTYWLNL